MEVVTALVTAARKIYHLENGTDTHQYDTSIRVSTMADTDTDYSVRWCPSHLYY